MKKLISIVIIIVIASLLFNQVKAEELVIPKESIRLRVIANSDTPYDQKIKYQVKDYMESNISNLVKETTNIDEARTNIKNNINTFNEGIGLLFKQNNYPQTYNINFGYNYFPEKNYKGVKYEEGYYESLVVTIGEGKGNNWWCVLFPPLCLLEAEESSKVEYKLLVKEIIDKIFKH